MKTDATPDRDRRGSQPRGDTDRQVARRSARASAALVLVLLSVSVFSLWSAEATSIAARRVVAASRVSDDFVRAQIAVAAEESLERKYRLEPSPIVRATYDKASAALVAALGQVRRDGEAPDDALAARVLAEHKAYLAAIARMFAAVDRGDATAVLRIDGADVDPAFAVIETAVLQAASDTRASAFAELAHLQALTARTRELTPVVFLAGLLLAGVLGSISRGHRRLLDVERGRAVHLSLHDNLTALPNRALLTERLEDALARGSTSAVLLIDLDRFREVNDTFGHHYGDELLTQVGPRLTAAAGDGATIARFGGDEFAVLLADVTGVEAAVAVAARLRTALESPFDVEGIDLDIEASVGVVLSGEHGHDAATLLQRADIAMDVAKVGNLGVFAYDPGLDGHSPAKLALLGELRRALERDELVLHYQPKIDIAVGEVVGAEALVRWMHPEHGLVFPDEFIPLAERTGVITPLTRYVLDAALAQARRWRDAGHPLQVSVNLSARNLLDEALPQQVARQLADHGVGAGLLELEVTESAIMTDPVRARHVLEELAALGVRISLDDFGTGYTSLGQLRTLPVSELKIDRSFVMAMADDPSTALIVRSIIDLGHNLGLTIVAEGVENEGVLTALRAIGCDIAQGYHLSRPVAADVFDSWLAGQRGQTRQRVYGRIF